MPPAMTRLGLLALWVLLSGTSYGQESDLGSAFKKSVQPLLETHCVDCHSAPDLEGGLDLELFLEAPLLATNRSVLRHVRSKIRSGEMPPPKKSRLTSREKLTIISWASAALAQQPTIPNDPGRVVMRRLSRFEYDRTIFSLFGVRAQSTQAFPGDDLLFGFDNLGGAATMSVLHLEKYADAAEEIARLVIDTEDPENPTIRHVEAEEMACTLEGATDGSNASLFSRGTVTETFDLPRDGTYRLHIRVWGDQAGSEAAKMQVEWDNEEIALIDVAEDRTMPATKEIEISTTQGRHSLALSFVNDYYRPDAVDRNQRDRNLHIDYVKLIGPTNRLKPSFGQSWMFAKDKKKGKPEKRARPILEELCLRAWRRPPTRLEVKRLSKMVSTFVADGLTFMEAMQFAMQAVLISPNFLFRIEPGDNRGRKNTIKSLKDYAIATRLSYFLWSCEPDDELRRLAKKKQLRDPEVLIKQMTRMLADPKSNALAESFASQWLELRNLADTTPDTEKFPTFNKELRQALKKETELLFMDVLRRKAPALELITADFSYLNETLAKHYRIPGVKGDNFRKVQLNGRRTGGLLAHGSMLAVTSNPTRTSPVKRGKWLLENIFDAPPPPPPPGVDNFAGGDVSNAANLREQMKIHRQNPACAACHVRMDALGLALENFDAIGRYREEDGGNPIDTTSILPNGEKIKGIDDLQKMVEADDAFLRVIAKRMFVYAIGRRPNLPDKLAIDAMIAKFDWRQATINDIIKSIITMDAFRKRRVVR